MNIRNLKLGIAFAAVAAVSFIAGYVGYGIQIREKLAGGYLEVAGLSAEVLANEPNLSPSTKATLEEKLVGSVLLVSTIHPNIGKMSAIEVAPLCTLHSHASTGLSYKSVPSELSALASGYLDSTRSPLLVALGESPALAYHRDCQRLTSRSSGRPPTAAATQLQR